MSFVIPPADCLRCARLVQFRCDNQTLYPDFYNGAVPSFGSLNADILIVGLAPGLKGANATGRPFTGDYAGDVLYPALVKAGLAKGQYGQLPNDGLELIKCRITNAVRCVPPENKPTTAEIKECNPFLRDEIMAMPNLKVILSLGGISHKAVLQCLGYKQSAFAFGHGAEHRLSYVSPEGGKALRRNGAPSAQSGALGGHGDEIEKKTAKGFREEKMQFSTRRSSDAALDCVVEADASPRRSDIILLNSYHTSRYNVNTGRLTEEMFADIIELVIKNIG